MTEEEFLDYMHKHTLGYPKGHPAHEAYAKAKDLVQWIDEELEGYQHEH